jgi:hypothetical protein
MKKIIVLLFLLLSEKIIAQCAMCKAVVESGYTSEAEGLNSGILYLMVFPYLLVGALLFFVIKHNRKQKIK